MDSQAGMGQRPQQSPVVQFHEMHVLVGVGGKHDVRDLTVVERSPLGDESDLQWRKPPHPRI